MPNPKAGSIHLRGPICYIMLRFSVQRKARFLTHITGAQEVTPIKSTYASKYI